MIARDLWVSACSVKRRRQAWREGWMAALCSASPANFPTDSDAQLAVVEEDLVKGPAAHSFPDQRWPDVAVHSVMGLRLRVSHLLTTVWQLLKRHGWSWQTPTRSSDEHAVESWKRQLQTPSAAMSHQATCPLSRSGPVAGQRGRAAHASHSPCT
jgi:putative transposase